MLKIVYQNQDLLVIDKPNNLIVQKNKYYLDSIEETLNKNFPFLSVLSRQGIVHRLDRQTTGLLLVAKNEKMLAYLSSLFKERKIIKVYLALVEGNIENESGEITLCIQKSFPKKGKIKMSMHAQKGKIANIFFKVIERLGEFSFVKVFPSTGRTHQIRVAFQNIKHPIYNDPIYNQKCNDLEIGQFLHAHSLEFSGQNQEDYFFKSCLPDFFQKKLKQLKSKTWKEYS